MTAFQQWLKANNIELKNLSTEQFNEARERFKKEIQAQKGDTSKIVNKQWR